MEACACHILLAAHVCTCVVFLAAVRGSAEHCMLGTSLCRAWLAQHTSVLATVPRKH